MNNIDAVFESYLARLNFCPLCNHAINAVSNLYTFKGLVLIPVLWWLWCRADERREWTRQIVIATILSGILALFIGRVLADFLPFRARPINTPELHQHFASILHQESVLPTWSSFPSDHAMLWMSVAVGIFIISRRVGVLALLYTAIFICVPRAYLGIHYPTDLLAGALIGIVITYGMTRDSIRNLYAPTVLRWMERYPGLSAMLAFVLCLELVTQFDELRQFASSVYKIL
ncbi:phosphatase PAP2 family protein [Paraburkholderia panacisoli]|uniref:Phosphatase PAP2 family protein n=1 Tax=Paraburkholderia panacisoli TaxID=2603818 RepID=A0A5B0GC13_9BURK|nr:phosphatase PAP2 family protein [Paraburkholderia panacisoli]KAA1000964.1 phosphatase PAP2 family protein [Paraburkholderia panacisoli]